MQLILDRNCVKLIEEFWHPVFDILISRVVIKVARLIRLRLSLIIRGISLQIRHLHYLLLHPDQKTS